MAQKKLTAAHKASISKARQAYELSRQRKADFLQQLAEKYLAKVFTRITPAAISKIVTEMESPEAIMTLCEGLNTPITRAAGRDASFIGNRIMFSEPVNPIPRRRSTSLVPKKRGRK